VSVRAGLDTEARGKILCLFRESKPGSPVFNNVNICNFHTWYRESFVGFVAYVCSKFCILPRQLPPG
jgi:hypothetical protein